MNETMSDLKKLNKSVNVEKVENGYIIRKSWSTQPSTVRLGIQAPEFNNVTEVESDLLSLVNNLERFLSES